MGDLLGLRENVAQALWFDFVDQQGYPNGLPTWDEMSVASDRSNRCAEYLSYADAVLPFLEALRTDLDRARALGWSLRRALPCPAARPALFCQRISIKEFSRVMQWQPGGVRA